VRGSAVASSRSPALKRLQRAISLNDFVRFRTPIQATKDWGRRLSSARALGFFGSGAAVQVTSSIVLSSAWWKQGPGRSRPTKSPDVEALGSRHAQVVVRHRRLWLPLSDRRHISGR
jgi:hypothetical protein